MIGSLWIAKTGLDAQQTNMDVIANNLANVSTNGFKRQRAVFEDLLYQTIRQPGAQSSEQTTLPSGLQIGTGVRPVATERLHSQGNLSQTNNSKDVAIKGEGFFQVLLPDGTSAYTRDGSFQVDQNGQLVTSGGFQVQPAITIPANTLSITIGRDGVVSATQQGGDSTCQVGAAQPDNLYDDTGLESIGEKPVPRNTVFRHAEHHHAGAERGGSAVSGVCGNLERKRGGRTGEHDPGSARL